MKPSPHLQCVQHLNKFYCKGEIANMLTWHYLTSETFDAGVAAADGLYFLSDTKEIYRGNELFSGAFEIMDDADSDLDTVLAEVTRPAHGKIYLSKTTLEGRVYDGAAWQTVIRPVATAIADGGTGLVTADQVHDYVAEQIAGVTGGENFVHNITCANGVLTVEGGDGGASSQVQLSGLGASLEYNAGTGALQLKDLTGVALGTAVNLDLERFVSAAAYDAAAHEIILAFTGVASIDTGASYTYPDGMPGEPAAGLACRATAEGEPKWYVYEESAWAEIPAGEVPLVIEVGDLVDTYTATNTQTIEMSVLSNQFSANVRIDSVTGGNLLTQNANGLYVAPVDLSSCMQLVDSAVENNIATFGTGGQVKDSGVKVGGATLAANDATTVATEAAVEAIRAALQTAIDGKIAKMSGATAGNVVTATADGQVQDSGKVIGGATLNGTPNENTLATEAAVSAAITAAKADVLLDSDVKTTLADADTDATIPSSKAVVDALKWVTTM